MAQATNTTLGEVVLGGDLGGDANLPELRASGVTPGTYAPVQRLSVDAKGRVTSVGQTIYSDILPFLTVATSTTKGIFSAGSNVSISSGSVSIPTASSFTKGVFSFTTGLVNSTSITLDFPNLAATGSVFGFVKSGANITNTAGVLSIADATTSVKGVASFNPTHFSTLSGAVSVNTQGLDVATGSVFGVVKSGANITNTAGVLSVAEATGSVFGVVKSGANITNTAGVLSVDTASTTTKGVFSFTTGLVNSTSITLDFPNLAATGSVFGFVKSGANITNTAGVLSVAEATGSVFGVVKSGANITNTAGVLSVPDASTSVKGVASFDDTYFTSVSGAITLNSSVLPAATGSVFGFVKSGANITNTAGVLSVAEATGSVFGVVKSGANITNTAGVLSVADATTSVKGVASFSSSNFTVTSGVVAISTPLVKTDVQNTFTLAQNGSYQSLFSPMTFAPNFQSDADVTEISMSGDLTIYAPTFYAPSNTIVQLKVVLTNQFGYPVYLDGAYKTNKPLLFSTDGKSDVLHFICTSSACYVILNEGF